MQALRTTVRGSTQGSVQATAPERLELRNQIMKKRQEQMEKSTAAFKDLYAALTPEQKAIADQRLGRRPRTGSGSPRRAGRTFPLSVVSWSGRAAPHLANSLQIFS